MDYYTKLDEFFGKTEDDIHPLEKAARHCLRESLRIKNPFVAMVAHNCAITIRNMPDWKVYIGS